jgi:hypothetical protein
MDVQGRIFTPDARIYLDLSGSYGPLWTSMERDMVPLAGIEIAS